MHLFYVFSYFAYFHRSVTLHTGFSVLVCTNQFFGDPIQCDLVSENTTYFRSILSGQKIARKSQNRYFECFSNNVSRTCVILTHQFIKVSSQKSQKLSNDVSTPKYHFHFPHMSNNTSQFVASLIFHYSQVKRFPKKC